MPLAIIQTTFDRKTGQKIGEKIIDHNPNINKDEIYQPLIEILYRDFYTWWKENQNTAV